LIFARTDTIGFHAEVFAKAYSIFFFKSRLKFNGIISQLELNTPTEAVRKRIKGKTLNRINADYSWFKGDAANAPSCLISYTHDDSQIINDAFNRGDIKGCHVIL